MIALSLIHNDNKYECSKAQGPVHFSSATSTNMTEQTNAATKDEANEEIPVRHGTHNSMEKMLM